MSVATQEQPLTFTAEDNKGGTYTLEQRETAGFVDEITYKNDVITVSFSDGNQAIETEQGTAYLNIPQLVKDKWLKQGFVPPEDGSW